MSPRKYSKRPKKIPRVAVAEICPAFFTWMETTNGNFRPRIEELPDMMTVPAAARFLKLSPSTIKWLCDKGYLACQRATPRRRSKRLIPKSAILRYRAQRQQDQQNRDAAWRK